MQTFYIRLEGSWYRCFCATSNIATAIAGSPIIRHIDNSLRWKIRRRGVNARDGAVAIPLSRIASISMRIAAAFQYSIISTLQIDETSGQLADAESEAERIKSVRVEDERRQEEMTSMLHDLRDKLNDEQRRNEELQQSVS